MIWQAIMSMPKLCWDIAHSDIEKVITCEELLGKHDNMWGVYEMLYYKDDLVYAFGIQKCLILV